MRKMAFAMLVAVFTVSSAVGTGLAQDTCRNQVIGKYGKPLTGAAPTSFMKKCANDACEAKAVDKTVKSSPELQKPAS